ncbi:DUF416 family protein [Hymenobacter sediminicola]|uniref:DUF416 family protein n=1 Tax=Hymenobacter sediminicola TaxID=2761579 RepID=A0A7G7W5E4_9BACT|nr:DUF416 family protein [Hymenobacter sediminicola]QNH61587.1 DUF416 family protein [Hymenobacter sediminicola]
MLHYSIPHLPIPCKAVIAALTCAKMQPLYAAFCESESWGNSGVYEDGIQALFSFALTNSADEAVRVLPEFEQWFPDLDDFESILTSYAFDSSVALTEALLFVSTQDNIHFENHLTAATDCIDMFVQDLLDLDPNQPDLNKIIEASGYMQREFARRNSLLFALQENPAVTTETIEHLKLLNSTNALVELELLDKEAQ